jgi:lipopolysaccharide export system protein LptC
MSKSHSPLLAADKSGRGFSLRPKDTARLLARSGHHSRRVGLLRWLLPTLAALILALLVLWPIMNNSKIVQTAAATIPNLVIDNLHFTGVDKDNQPYSVVARLATQVPNAKGVIDLDQPQAEVTLQDGAWLSGKARQGRFDQQGNRLWLGGDVEFFHDGGYQVQTDEAQFDIKNNLAWGEKPVLIHGGFGTIQGDAFHMLDRGKVVVITGHARAVLNMQDNAPAPKSKPK